MKKRLQKQKNKEFEKKMGIALQKLETFDTVEMGLSEINNIFTDYQSEENLEEIISRFRSIMSKIIFYF